MGDPRDEVLDAEALDALERAVDDWFRVEAEENPMIAAVERGERGERRWYVRVRGDQKDTFTLWFTLGQRTLRYETYVMPAPEEHHAAFYEHLLVRNLTLRDWAFAVGEESAVFLVGSVGVEAIADGAGRAATLDRLLGSGWEAVERCFRPALRIGFSSKVQ